MTAKDPAQRCAIDTRKSGEERIARCDAALLVKLTPGQRRARRPRRPHRREEAPEPIGHLLGKAPVRRNLAAEYRQHRRQALAAVEPQGVIAGHGGRIARTVVIQRAHAGVVPDHLRGVDGIAQVAVYGAAQIVDFLLAHRGSLGVRHLFVGRSHQGEPLLVGNHEDHATVVVLQQKHVLTLIQARHDDVASFDEPHRVARRLLEALVQHLFHPRAGGIDDDATGDGFAVRQSNPPQAVPALTTDARRAREDAGAAFPRAERVRDDQPRIVYTAIRVLEPMVELRFERRRVGCSVDAHAVRSRQRPRTRVAPPLPSAKMVVQEQPRADHPARSQFRDVRHDETRRPDQMRRDPQEHLALGERFGDQAKLVMLQIAQAAMNELRGPGRGGAREVVLLHEHDR